MGKDGTLSWNVRAKRVFRDIVAAYLAAVVNGKEHAYKRERFCR